MTDADKAAIIDDLERARRRIEQGNLVAADDAIVRALRRLGIAAEPKS